MPLLKVVLDTNCLLRSVSRRSAYSSIVEQLNRGAYELCETTEILLEYEQKLTDIFSKEVAELVIGAFTLMTNIKNVEPYFHLSLIHSDPDDNKLVDCAFSANAHLLLLTTSITKY